MLWHRRIVRISILAGLAVLSFVLVGATALYIRQHLIRRDSQQLLDLVQSIRPRETTFAELQPQLQRWIGAIHYDGPCTGTLCDLRIAVPKAVFAEPAGTYFARMWILRPQQLAGLRPTLTVASISIRKGVAWGTSFDVQTFVPTHKIAAGLEGYTLVGQFETLSRFWNRPDRRRTRLHPNYVVNRPSACDGCALLWVRSTSYAEPTEIEPLMQFNLACITTWQPCRTTQQLMPNAWRRYIDDEAKLRELGRQNACDGTRLKLLGRDAENVALIEIRSTETIAEGSTRVTARLIERLKRTDFWPINNDAAFWLRKTDMDLESHASLRAGERLIALFDHIAPRNGSARPPLLHPEEIVIDECGLIRPTAQNLNAIQAGIAQDWRATE